MKRCKHVWGDPHYDYTPPASGFTAEKINQDLAYKLTMGFTNVTQRCTLCGLVTSSTHYGKVSGA